MTAETSPLRPRPRYDAVYRSAERLIASRPSPSPSRRRPRRSLIFLLGVTCGLVPAFLLWRASDDIVPIASKREATTTTVYRERKRLQLPLADARATFGANAPARPVAPNNPPIATPTTSTAVALVPAHPTRSAPATPRSTPTAAAGALMTPAMILSRFTTSFKLRGEARATNGTKSHIEFDLQLLPAHLGGTVEGSVRYIDGNPRPRNPIQLSGLWMNRTLTLQETVKANALPQPQGWVFVLEFPETDASDDVTGYWSHRGQTGTLALRPLLPL